MGIEARDHTTSYRLVGTTLRRTLTDVIMAVNGLTCPSRRDFNFYICDTPQSFLACYKVIPSFITSGGEKKTLISLTSHKLLKRSSYSCQQICLISHSVRAGSACQYD